MSRITQQRSSMLAFSLLVAPVTCLTTACSSDGPGSADAHVTQGNPLCNSPNRAKNAKNAKGAKNANDVESAGRARYIVTLRPPNDRATRAARGLGEYDESLELEAIRTDVLAKAKSLGAEPEIAHTWKHIPVFAAELDPAALDTLRADPHVAHIEPDGQVQASLAESLPLIHADAANASGYKGAGQKVVILDTGAVSKHPMLAGKIVDEACFCMDDCTPCCPNGQSTQTGPGAAADDEGHGSHVAGIVAGVAPAATLVVVKVLSARGKGEDSSTISALDWVLEHHPDAAAINMSFGDSGHQYAGDCDGSFVGYAAAIDKLRSRGVLAAAASGNDASVNGVNHPACLKNVVSVGAVYDANFGWLEWKKCKDPLAKADRIVCYSNSGSNLDILAPGYKIRSVDFAGDGTTEMGGTSQATPHVAGAVAVVRAANPRLGPAAIEEILQKTGVPIKDPRNDVTRSRIDVDAAVKEAVRRGSR
ncbi:S8 family peptidase [Pendulispora albinea]|uniref:S8 family serine peptidase n=1 Tax=Pendulispora albinea TaxID=2741071 RepID=A0ABZ2M8J4_9BACT